MLHHWPKFLLLTCLALLSPAYAEQEKIPQVLFLGDSIHQTIVQAAAKELEGKVSVRYPSGIVTADSGTALAQIDSLVGKTPWDIIYFNFGIHDRKTPAADYEQRLETLIARMQKTGAKIIFATTTPVPPDTKDGPEIVTQIAEKNEIALRVMKKHGIAIDDLYSFLAPQLQGIANPQDVHFNAKGYEIMGQQVAKSIEAQLK